jgi:hypothetical protein
MPLDAANKNPRREAAAAVIFVDVLIAIDSPQAVPPFTIFCLKSAL